MKGLAAGSAVALLAACGEPTTAELPPDIKVKLAPQGAPPEPAVTTVAAPSQVEPEGPVSLTLGIATGNIMTAHIESTINAAVADLQGEKPDLDIRVVRVDIGPELTDLDERFMTGIESALDEGKTLDIFAVPAREIMVQLAEKELIHDLDRFISQTDTLKDRAYYALAEAAIVSDGRRWALPWGMTP